jgi:hypothetical protein
MPPSQHNSVIQKWITIAFVNLFIVSFLGVIMRYKIAFYLPFIEQSNFLHAHSNFAFSGWLTQALMTLMWAILFNYLPASKLKHYKCILIANLIAAYGMLLGFCFEGYGFVSVTFSSITILVSYVFAIIFWRDLNKIKVKIISIYWFKAALLWNVLSSLGVFFLSYVMAQKTQHANWFLAGTYYFLHFQYNGWFFFACMGLFSEKVKFVISFLLQKRVFWLFTFAFIPSYFLSALWLPIPVWIYILVVAAAIAELLGWIVLLRSIVKNRAFLITHFPRQAKSLFILAAIALSIKLLLQVGSVIPPLSKLAFGFRPVVIGYLHLMFLGVITLFIMGFCQVNRFIINNSYVNMGISFFVAGIILNEIFLMVQGLSYMNYINLPYINESLLGAALCMFCGMFLLIIGLQKSNYKYRY